MSNTQLLQEIRAKLYDIDPKIILVNQNGPHNKYYTMNVDNINSKLNVQYGRIGNAPQAKTYSKSLWNKKLREKLNKGYHIAYNAKVPYAGSKETYDVAILNKIDKLYDRLDKYNSEYGHVFSVFELWKKEVLKFKNNYTTTGIIEPETMKLMNKYWTDSVKVASGTIVI